MIGYKDNILMCEDIDIRELAEVYDSPFYVYSKNDIFLKIGFKNFIIQSFNC